MYSQLLLSRFGEEEASCGSIYAGLVCCRLLTLMQTNQNLIPLQLLCISIPRLSVLSLLGYGVKGLRIVRFFWLTVYTYVFVAGGQAYLLDADFPTRSMRVMRLYFLFLVREKWQPEK